MGYKGNEKEDENEEKEIKSLQKALKKGSKKRNKSSNYDEIKQKLQQIKGKRSERELADRKRKLMTDVKQKEKELISQGKKAFYLKKSDKRRLELEDRYEMLKEQGQGKLEKYMAKRRRKNAAKERRWMPESRPEKANG